MCLLREQGQADEAAQLEAGTLPEMVAALRGPDDTDATLAARLDSILALEMERVANAAVLAELLAPLLQPAVARPTASLALAPSLPSDAMPLRAPRALTGDIADFIDEMIAQERAPDAPQRRAS